ncbi:MAG TPA: hypothetical protein ENK46_10970 [Flavobacteriia bacterium]|nr:hypothetical protein [Flavobacteriia bacterium]
MANCLQHKTFIVQQLYIIVLLGLFNCQKPVPKPTILDNCLSIEQVNLLTKMIRSFEDDLSKYYHFSKNEPEKTIKKYLNEIKTPMKNDSLILEIASPKSKELLQKSFTILSDDVWTTYQEEYGNMQDNIYILEEGDTLEAIIKDEQEALKRYKNKHLVRTNGKLVDCFYSKTSDESSKELFRLLMDSGAISPDIIINGILSLKTKISNSKEIEAYIALDLFYSPLDFNLK